MAQSLPEIAKDMVVALLSKAENINYGSITTHSKELGEAIAQIYRRLLEEVKKP